MSRYKVDITGINTSELEALKNAEMLELFLEYQKTGKKEIKDKIVEGNFLLVLNILKNFGSSRFNMDDLFQVGCIGLVKAVDNFDLSYGVMFSTYAVPLIVGEIKRYTRVRIYTR